MSPIAKPKRDSRLIETEAIVVAYAMSRLNEAFLERAGYKSWRGAFAKSGALLGVPPASMKNLRDEFDPLHGFRKGWHRRPLRPNRQRVLAAFCEVSDQALLEIAQGILSGNSDASEEVVVPLAMAKERIDNVAERLRTGRIAEQFFMDNTDAICGIAAGKLVDRRNEAAGYDFGVKGDARIAIEVKGLKPARGPILFTDREWEVARARQADYWLVVVGGLASKPKSRLWQNPVADLSPRPVVRRATTVSWQVLVSVA